jgi:hypothetical protein
VIGSREETMHRLTVLYPAKDGEAFNYDYYFGPHHKLVVSRFKPEGMVSCEFDKGVSDPAGDKAPYFAISSSNRLRTFKKRSPNMARRYWATSPITRRSNPSCK